MYLFCNDFCSIFIKISKERNLQIPRSPTLSIRTEFTEPDDRGRSRGRGGGTLLPFHVPALRLRPQTALNTQGKVPPGTSAMQNYVNFSFTFLYRMYPFSSGLFNEEKISIPYSHTLRPLTKDWDYDEGGFLRNRPKLLVSMSSSVKGSSQWKLWSGRHRTFIV